MDGLRAQTEVQGRPALEQWVLACAAAVVYYALARVGLQFAFGHANAPPLWPAAGFALAAVLLWGPNAAIGVFFGAWMAEEHPFVATGASAPAAALALSAFVGLGSAAQALMGAALLRRSGSPEDMPRSPRDAAAFCLLAPLIALISPGFDLLALALKGMPPGMNAARTGLSWWIAETVGLLVVAPLVLCWARPRRKPALPTASRAAEGLAAAALLAGGVALGLAAHGRWSAPGATLLFAAMPPMLWILLRFGPRAATAAVAAQAAAVAWLALHGDVFIIGATARSSLLTSSAYLAALSVAVLAARALLAEREAAMKAASADDRAARKTLEMHRRIYEHLPAGLMILRLEERGGAEALRIVDVNPSGRRMPGAAGEELGDIPLSRFAPEVSENGLQAMCLAVLKSGESRVLRDYLSAGRVPGANFNVTIFALSDKEVGLSFEDVSEQKKAQRIVQESMQMLLLMVGSVREYAIFRLDPEGRVASWTKGAEQIYGYREDEILGSPYARFMPLEDTARGAPRSQLDEVDREGRVSSESWCVRKDGTRFWAGMALTALRDAAGALLGYVCVVHDATQRRASEQAVEKRSADLTRSNVELAQFAYVASHDLSAPLHKVKAFADRLQGKLEGKLDDEGADYMRRMIRAVDGMQSLIDSLLELARVTTRGGAAEEVDLRALAKDVVEGLDLTIAKVKARVEIGALPRINADPLQMRQLLQNLVTNALKFQRPGARPHVRINGKATDDGRCELTVSDNGIGFDMKYADRIFQPFQRLNGRYEYEGSGMGLAICQKIVARHGGSISAKSELGHGAEFRVLLPISQEGRMECQLQEKAFS
ncbi:MAG: MASE1 domain-containing protein [Elusimicrobia bacterium]|nr:MASE1 domain-containing protein [Elusimicrobiota bacterium]